MVKVDESELPGDPRRFRITNEGIERIGFSDGCVGVHAIHSEYCRRRVQEDFRSTEEGRERLDKAEERFTEALVWAGERMESIGMRAAMNLGENRGASTTAQAGAWTVRVGGLDGAGWGFGITCQ